MTDSWLSDLLASIDAKDTEQFLSFLTEDAEFRFGNGPAIRGAPAIRAAVDAFFDTINASEHRIVRTWDDDETLVCQGDVTYERHDRSRITLPFVNILEMRTGKIDRYLIYVDIAPLYSASSSK